MASRLYAAPIHHDDVEEEVVLVHADALDDVSSVRPRLAGLSDRRVALVLPNRSAAFDSPAVVHILARVAAQERVRLALVTGRRRVRYWAEIEGLPTFWSPGQVPRRVLPPERTLLGQVELAIAALFRQFCIQMSWVAAIVIVLVILGLAVLLIPRAQVYVQPVTQPIGSNVTIRASVDALTLDAQKGLVPGRQIYLAVDASGSVPIPASSRPLDGRAVGFVTLTNQTKDKILVPAGTDVSTIPGVHFQTTQSATLDARNGASAVVPVRAQVWGPGGNVKSGEILIMAVELRWRVSVTNGDPTAGGGPASAAIVTAWDTRALVDQVTRQAQALARQRLAEQTTSGEIVVPESIQMVPIVENFDHHIGDRVDDAAPRVAVQMQFRTSAMIVNQDQLRALAIQMWNPTIPREFELRPGSVDVDPPTVVKVEDQSVTFSAPVHATTLKDINPERIVQYVRLRTPAAAERDLSQLFDLASEPHVTIVPNWIGRAYRVDVVLDTSAAPTTGPPAAAPDQAGGAR
jgi:Baseplate J-like protein